MFAFFRRKNRNGEMKDYSKYKATKKKPSKRSPTKELGLDDVPGLLDKMMNANDEKSAATVTKSIVDLCDTRHQENRIRMVCSKEYNTLPILIQSLIIETNDSRRILACAALINLSSSPESRRAIANGPSMKSVIDCLCRILHSSKSSENLRGLSLRCIRNLSMAFSANSIKTVLRHSPCQNGKELESVDNSKSLLRVLEKHLLNQQIPRTQQVVICDLIHNFAFSRDNAKVIVKTQIPELLLDNIRSSTISPSQWESGSLEKISLYAIRNLGRWPECRERLICIGILDVMKAIVESKKNKILLNAIPPQTQTVQDSTSDVSVATTADSTVHNYDISFSHLNFFSDGSVASTTADTTLQYDDMSSTFNIPTASDSNVRTDDDSLNYPVTALTNRPWAEIARIPIPLNRKPSKGWVLGIMAYQAPQKRYPHPSDNYKKKKC